MAADAANTALGPFTVVGGKGHMQAKAVITVAITVILVTIVTIIIVLVLNATCVVIITVKVSS